MFLKTMLPSVCFAHSKACGISIFFFSVCFLNVNDSFHFFSLTRQSTDFYAFFSLFLFTCVYALNTWLCTSSIESIPYATVPRWSRRNTISFWVRVPGKHYIKNVF